MQVITLTQASHSVVNFGNQPYFQFGRKDPDVGRYSQRFRLHSR